MGLANIGLVPFLLSSNLKGLEISFFGEGWGKSKYLEQEHVTCTFCIKAMTKTNGKENGVKVTMEG